jgi:hypothetical protein
MPRHEAVFEIDSESDSDAVSRVLERVYDSVREESRSVRQGSEDSTETIAAFEALRDAAAEPAPGRLRVVYERDEDGFEN